MSIYAKRTTLSLIVAVSLAMLLIISAQCRAMNALIVIPDSEPIIIPPIHDEVEEASLSSFAQVARETDQPWVILTLVPDIVSGSLFVGKASAHGPYPMKEGTSAVLGSYSVTEQLGTSIHSKNGQFYWEIPRFGFTKEEDGLLIASAPFYEDRSTKSRSLLCMLHETETGSKRFSEVHIVPDDWKTNLLPAVTYFRTHPLLLTEDIADDPHASTVHEALEALTINSNPYIVLTAYQLLSKRHSFTRDDMSRALTIPNPRLRASVVSSVCLDGWQGFDNNDQWLVKQVKTSKSLDQLEGIVLGVDCAADIVMKRFPKARSMMRSHSASPSDNQQTANAVLMGEVRHKLQELYHLPFSTDDRANAIDEICRSYGE